MPKKQVTLETAAFLDSEAYRSLSAPARSAAQPILQAFFGVCFDELGKSPHLLEGQELGEILTRLLPRHLKRDDPLAAQVPEVLRATFDHLETTRLVSHSFEVRHALEEGLPGFLERVRSGDQARAAAPKSDPFVHGASKLGRNDPCSCGSGKKYKKCHGKNA